MCANVVRLLALSLLAAAIFPVVVTAQTEALPAIAREAFRPRPEPPPPAAPLRVVPERVVVEPQVSTERAVAEPVVVTEKPVVRERVIVPERVITWWTAFARNRFGYYDDGYLDDNWFYDYYEPPKATAVVADRAVGAVPGYRTNWIYEPLAERGLFSW